MTIVLYLIVIHNCKFPAREDISEMFISDLFFICCTNVKQFSWLLIIWQWLCNSRRSRSIFTRCSKIIVSCLLIVNKEKIQFMWYPVAPTAYSVRVYCALWSRLNNYVMTASIEPKIKRFDFWFIDLCLWVLLIFHFLILLFQQNRKLSSLELHLEGNERIIAVFR